MKATAYLHTWKKAAEPTNWHIFDLESEEKIEFEANSLKEAKLHILNNYPASKVVGLNVQLENGDFSMDVVPDCYITEGIANTFEEMVDYMRRNVENRW